MHSSSELKFMNNEAVSLTFTAGYEAEIKFAESKGMKKKNALSKLERKTREMKNSRSSAA